MEASSILAESRFFTTVLSCSLLPKTRSYTCWILHVCLTLHLHHVILLAVAPLVNREADSSQRRNGLTKVSCGWTTMSELSALLLTMGAVGQDPAYMQEMPLTPPLRSGTKSGFSSSQSHSLCPTTVVRGWDCLFTNSTGHQMGPKLGARDSRLLRRLSQSHWSHRLGNCSLPLPLHEGQAFAKDDIGLAARSYFTPWHNPCPYSLEAFDFPINWFRPLKTNTPPHSAHSSLGNACRPCCQIIRN